MVRAIPTASTLFALMMLSAGSQGGLVAPAAATAANIQVENIIVKGVSNAGEPRADDRTAPVMADATAGNGTPGSLPASSSPSAAPEIDGAPGVADTVDTPFFPEVVGDNLEGKRYRLPADFEGKQNVVLIAFQRDQQAQVDTWMPFLRQLAAEQPDLRYYELPTIKEMGRVMRWVINSGMARGIDDPKAREATITLFIDKEPFTRALRIGTEETISLVVVDRSGRVDWQTAGTCTTEKERALRDVLAGR